MTQSYSHTLNVKSKGERANKQHYADKDPNLKTSHVVVHCYNITHKWPKVNDSTEESYFHNPLPHNGLRERLKIIFT